MTVFNVNDVDLEVKIIYLVRNIQYSTLSMHYLIFPLEYKLILVLLPHWRMPVFIRVHCMITQLCAHLFSLAHDFSVTEARSIGMSVHIP